MPTVRGMEPHADIAWMPAFVVISRTSAYASIMHARTVRDLGGAIRGRRRALGWTQGQLAQHAGVTRQWVSAMEKGKPTAEIAPILRSLAALGLVADVVEAPVPHGEIDLDNLLDGPGD